MCSQTAVHFRKSLCKRNHSSPKAWLWISNIGGLEVQNCRKSMKPLVWSWLEGELLKNLCFMSYLANLFHLLQGYGFTISIIDSPFQINPSAFLFTRMCWGISMETTVIQGSQLHPTHAFQLNSTRHRLREIWEILDVEQKQKKKKTCMFMYFSRYPHWSGWETTDCHCHSHPRKGVGFFP